MTNTHMIVIYPDGFVCSCHWRWSIDTTSLQVEDSSILCRMGRERHDKDLQNGYKVPFGWQDPPVAMSPAFRSDAIDAQHLARQRSWSRDTFGPGPRTLGILDHIRKELEEIFADPLDVGEWVDVIILAFDGAWRAGWDPQEIIFAIKRKQAENEARSWPDWRTKGQDEAIEHVRTIA